VTINAGARVRCVRADDFGLAGLLEQIVDTCSFNLINIRGSVQKPLTSLNRLVQVFLALSTIIIPSSAGTVRSDDDIHLPLDPTKRFFALTGSPK